MMFQLNDRIVVTNLQTVYYGCKGSVRAINPYGRKYVVLVVLDKFLKTGPIEFHLEELERTGEGADSKENSS